MKYDVTLERIANCYYNLGLERAKLRDLSGAAELLKKALHYDKYQREARNLLGLIFFEMGEVADALVQWVISMNLLPETILPTIIWMRFKESRRFSGFALTM